jgi:hypothetical protein
MALFRQRVDGGKIARRKAVQQLRGDADRVERRVCRSVNGEHVRPHGDAAPFQNLPADGARKDERRGESPGKAAAAAHIVEAAVAQVCRVVRVAGARHGAEVRIV